MRILSLSFAQLIQKQQAANSTLIRTLNIVLRPVSEHINSCTNFDTRATTSAETYDTGHRGCTNTEETGFEQIIACNPNVRFHEPEVGRDSSVGVTTRYGLDGRGIES